MKNNNDLLSKARGRGQGVLVELPPASGKDSPIGIKRDMKREAAQQMIKGEGNFYDFTYNHPELCPPVGTVMYMKSPYGVKAKLTVKFVFRGLPGTELEILPLAEQPKHLQNKDVLAKHTGGIGRPGWVQWADREAWELYQTLEPKPEPQSEIVDLWPAPEPELSVTEKILGLYPEVMAGVK